MNDDGIRKGGPRDPVAQNIRNEQMADAMPSQEEAKAKARKALADEGCRDCGEDDPDNLRFAYVHMPECRAIQTPPDPTVVLCDSCHRTRPSHREQAIQSAREDEPRAGQGKILALTFYRCGNYETVREDLVECGRGETAPASHVHGVFPSVGIRCRCGEAIDDVVYLDGRDA